MASNFWTSSHFNEWMVDRTVLVATRRLDLKYLSPRLLATLHIFFANVIQKIGKRLNLRQLPIATAQTYFKRFYLKNAFCETDPFLVAAACVYVATKVEETPIHIKSVANECKAALAEVGYFNFSSDHTKLAEMEFYLMEDIEFNLIVFHPYRSLGAMTGREPADSGFFPNDQVEPREIAHSTRRNSMKKNRDMETTLPERRDGESESAWVNRALSRGSGKGVMEVLDDTVELAWAILNDSYRSDVILVYPPYVISIAALFLAFALSKPASKPIASSPRRGSIASMTESSNSFFPELDGPSLAASGLSDDFIASLLGSGDGFAELFGAASTGETSFDSNNSSRQKDDKSNAAAFLAQFQVSLPTVLACLKDLLAIYPLWDDLDRAAASSANINAASRSNRSALLMRVPIKVLEVAYASANRSPALAESDMVTLVQKIQLERVVDVAHPGDGGTAPLHRPIPAQLLSAALGGMSPAMAGVKRMRQ